MKKLRLNFHLSLPYVVPLLGALFKHDFWKGNGGLSYFSGAFKSTNAPRTLHRRRFSRWLHWGSNGWAAIYPCFCHGEGDFCCSRHILLPRERWRPLTKDRWGITLIQLPLRHCLYAEKNFRVGKRLDFSDPFFPQKGRKTPKLGLAVVCACAEKSSEFSQQKHWT